MSPKEKIPKTILLSVIFGLLSSLVGSFTILSFVLPADYWLGSNNISSQNEELLKASLGVKAYGGLEVFKFLDSTLPTVAGIYKKKASAGANLADSLYSEKERLGSGFALTTDGWIISNKAVLDSLNVKGSKQLLAVYIKNKMYNVDTVIYDTWTDVVFLKINAENLSVAALGDSDLVKLGDLVFGGVDKNNFWFSYISGVDFYPEGGKVLYSEEFGKRIKLQDKAASAANGGLVANRSGEIIGIMVSEAKGNFVLPINYFKDLVSGVLKNKKVLRPYLGITYIDLNAAVAGDLPNSGNGAFVRSVSADSPAGKAGIKAGDIVIGVDDEGFNESKNLSEIISEFEPGDGVNLKVLRNGKEMNINIVLGAI
ncbi:MAG: PDZ domain-containing protein [Patescibacteria group bacterium]